MNFTGMAWHGVWGHDIVDQRTYRSYAWRDIDQRGLTSWAPEFESHDPICLA